MNTLERKKTLCESSRKLIIAALKPICHIHFVNVDLDIKIS